MSNQAEPGIIGGGAPDQSGFDGAVDERSQGRQAQAAYDAGEWFPPHAFHGRPVSWVAVSIIVVGFVTGGLALVFGPTWWVFWLGLAITVIGGLLALATNIFDDWY